MMLTSDIKPYRNYKETDQKWLGVIPSHWDLYPNRAIFSEVKDRNHPDEEMLSVTIKQGVIRQKTLLEGSSKKDASNLNKSAYKLVQPNDIAYNKMRAWQGAVGFSSFRGIISPAYVVMRLRDEALRPEYFHHLFRTPGFAKEAERWSYGITSDMWSLRPEHFKMIYSPIPPIPEQVAIIKFLEWGNQRIDKAIRAKKKLIGLLNEQKQAIIHRAVTRGIDSSIQLEDSGISWLGSIPQHWGVVRNMALFTPRVEPGVKDLPILQVSLRSGITVEEFDQFGRPKKLIADVTKYKLVRKGDISYNTMRMWQGAVGVAPCDGLVSPAYVVLKPRNGVFPEYYNLLFRTEFYKQEINRYSTGIVSDRNRLYWDQFKQIPNLAPPLDEQYGIVSYINDETKGLTAAVERSEREIVLLREYRNRLFADVVTGKLDVREAVEGLPDIEVAAEDAVCDANENGDEAGDSEEEGE
ncbi:MAG TPA: hypothetical protein PLP29_11590 [Candidatus Ozemobacteraceae bacterium]|nr:hypothetical protein [Candidatus Ozemobacteraceae bacterium]